jgi:bacillolysin
MKRLALSIFLLTSQLIYAQEKNTEKHFAEDKTISFLKFNSSKPKLLDAQKILKDSLKLSGDNSFSLKEKKQDEIGFTHLKYQQYFKNIKVEHGVYSVHGKNNEIDYMLGNFMPLKDIKITPTIGPDESITMALKYIGAKSYLWEDKAEEELLRKTENLTDATYFPKPELVIIKDIMISNSKFRLAYKIKIYASSPLSHRIYFIDAHNGEMLYIEDLIKHSNSNGTAQTRYSGSRNIISDSYSGGFRLRESRNGVAIETYNMLRSKNYNAAIDFSDNDNSWTAAEHNNSNVDNAALDAHWGAEMTYDYFLNILNRNSWNGVGGALKSYVHANLIQLGYPNNNNAFWDGTRMTYGDGSSGNTPLTALDIVAHEIGHGVTSTSADLVYNKESGALNEAFSDIFAACVEAYAAPGKQRWLIAEDIGAFRSMSSPNNYGQPDTYGGTYWVNVNNCSPVSSNDHCGVHTNSGVLNYWFYLIAEGGSGTNDLNNSYTVSPIGINDAAQIAYRTLIYGLAPLSNFADTRNASIQAAIDLYGINSCQLKAVTDAWYAVGVGGAYTGNIGMSISGALALCDSDNTYTISNLPSGSSVTSWTIEGYGANIVSNTASQVTISPIDYGYIKIRAIVSTPCGQIILVTPDITVGLPTHISNVEVSSNNFGSPPGTLCNHDVDIDDLVNTFTYTLNEIPRVPITLNYYILDPMGGAFYSHAITTTSQSQTFTLPQNLPEGEYYLEVYLSGGPCGGTTETFEVSMVYMDCNRAKISVFPNPSTSEFTVSMGNLISSKEPVLQKPNTIITSKQGDKSFDVKLLDKSSKILRQVASKGGQDISIDVSNIPNGIYYLHINEHGVVTKKQIIVKH